MLGVREHRARVHDAELKARLVPRDTNGHAPSIISKDGDTLIDPDVAPAGVVRGLNGKTPPSMPEPETPAHERAVNAARLIRLAGATGGIGSALAGFFGTPRTMGGQMPPLTEAPQGDVKRLVEASRADYRLVDMDAGDDGE